MRVESDLDHGILGQSVVVESDDTLVERLCSIGVGIAENEEHDAIDNDPHYLSANYAFELRFGLEAN